MDVPTRNAVQQIEYLSSSVDDNVIRIAKNIVGKLTDRHEEPTIGLGEPIDLGEPNRITLEWPLAFLFCEIDSKTLEVDKISLSDCTFAHDIREFSVQDELQEGIDHLLACVPQVGDKSTVPYLGKVMRYFE